MNYFLICMNCMNCLEGMQCMNIQLHLVMYELLRNLYGQHELFGRAAVHEYLILACNA